MKSLSFLIVVAVVFAVNSGARAGPYTLEIVAQAGDIIEDRAIFGFSSEVIGVGISDDREVAFFANVRGPQGVGRSLMTQRRFIAGAGKMVDGHVPQFGSEPSLAINGLGDVAYKATIPNVARGVFLNQKLLIMNGDEIDGEEISVIVDPPAVNNAGIVVIPARPGAIKLSLDGANEIIADNRAVIDGFTLDGISYPQINNAGKVVFGSGLNELPKVRDYSIVSPERVILKPGDVIEDLTISRIRAIGDFTDDGDIVAAMWGHGMDGKLVGFIGTQNRILVRAGDFVGGIQLDFVDSSVKLNNAGQLSFIGGVLAPGTNGFYDDARSMLFALNTVVISEGDLLGGKVVQELYPAFDMNEHGDLAFRVIFEDRSSAVVLATSNIPEPSSFVLAMLGICTLLARPRGRSRKRKGPQ